MEKFLYGRASAARALEISLRQIDYLIRKKKIKSVKIGKRTLVPQEEIARLARCGTGPTKKENVAPLGRITKNPSRDKEGRHE
jgi:excisionase family DNA binding protein